MKAKKVAAIIAGMALLTVGLTGCGGSTKEATFTSKAGIVVTATEQWKQLQSKEELTELYMDQVDDALEESVDLALKNGDKMYFTIETMDIQSDLDDLEEMAEMFKDESSGYSKEDVLEMLASSYDEDTVNILAQLLEDDVDFDLLYQQYSNVMWFEQLADGMEGYNFVTAEDATILGKQSSISEYAYTNSDGAQLHFYEASVVQDGVLYTLNGWCDDSDFSKNKDALKAMITSAAWNQQ